DIAQAILASLARRLAATSRSARPLRPLAPRCVAFLGDVPAPVLGALARGLPDWVVIGPGADDPRAALHRLESAGQKVLFIAPPAALLGEVDEAFDFAPLRATPTPA